MITNCFVVWPLNVSNCNLIEKTSRKTYLDKVVGRITQINDA